MAASALPVCGCIDGEGQAKKGFPSEGRSRSSEGRVGAPSSPIPAGDERHHLSLQKRPEPAQAVNGSGGRPASKGRDLPDLASRSEKKSFLALHVAVEAYH